MSDHLDELDGRLGVPLLRDEDAVPYSRPWRGPAGAALAVARPGSTAEVRLVVEWARRHRVRLLPQGAVTGLVGASTPPPGGPEPLVVSTERLRSTMDVDAESAVAVASAGIRLSELNHSAGPHGLELPVDLAADPALGAMVATDTGGSRVLRHGPFSAHLVGVEAVVADDGASVIGSLRGLRKDNTGPDPTRLLVGSAGAFGIVTAVAVALSPVPAGRATTLVGPVPDHSVPRLLAELRRHLGADLSAFEVMCPAAMRAGLATMDTPPAVPVGEEPDVSVLVEAAGPAGLVDRLVDAVARLGPEGIVLPAAVAWGVRHGITEGLASRGRVLGFDLSVRPSRLPELRSRARALVGELGDELVVADFGHWGDGGIHCNVVVPPGVHLDRDAEAALRSDMYALTVSLGGSYSAEHGIGPVTARWWVDHEPALHQELLAAFKARVDPLGVLGHPGVPFA